MKSFGSFLKTISRTSGIQTITIERKFNQSTLMRYLGDETTDMLEK